jgi:hypothetical protein
VQSRHPRSVEGEDIVSDDHDDDTASRAWAQRLALAACPDSLDGMRATVDDI